MGMRLKEGTDADGLWQTNLIGSPHPNQGAFILSVALWINNIAVVWGCCYRVQSSDMKRMRYELLSPVCKPGFTV